MRPEYAAAVADAWGEPSDEDSDNCATMMKERGLLKHEIAFAKALPYIPEATLARGKLICPMCCAAWDWRKVNGLGSFDCFKPEDKCRSAKTQASMEHHAKHLGCRNTPHTIFND